MAEVVRSVSISFPLEINEQGRPMLWFGAWLVGAEGVEGDWFHSGRGAAEVRTSIPPGATGIRLRRWPSDGFDAEYADILALDELTAVDARDVDFDVQQEFSLLRL